MQTATAGQGAARTPLARFFASTLGRKAVMALTGVVMFGFLLGLALKIALIGGVVYLAIRIVSPSSASKLRDRWGQ